MCAEKWLLDCGALEMSPCPEFVFLTHCHLDHVKDAPSLLNFRETNFFVPMESGDSFGAFMKAALAMHRAQVAGAAAAPSLPQYRLRCVEPNEVHALAKGYQVKIIRTVHTIAAVGYGFSKSVANRLQPRLVYLGDTTVEVFARSPELFDYPYIFVECTYLQPEGNTDRNCAQYRHTQWRDLEPVVEAHPNNCFVLTHFSMRYSSQYVRRFFATHAPRNVIPWVR
eukprot:TRINITY_DN1046_c0_g1_i2.p1 TRINITY_DN1046_c0_g1~~TRINITY_DN1046_c0_g1_i2.p1  ORF type:complete len:225 (+),score=58.90 TRINITY_DN1046_c0_g1_i2:391-1065(+)